MHAARRKPTRYPWGMNKPIDVAVLVGSLRKDSWNRKIALALQDLAPEGLRLDLVEFRDLPLYDDDLESQVPAAWQRFRERIRAADALLFVTPEYNRSIPGGLKNALDVGSRPYGKNNFAGKPGAVVTASPGAIGGFGANHHLRQALVFLDVPTLQQPEVYIGAVHTLFDENGKLVKEDTRQFLGTFLTTFERWIEKLRTP